MRAATAPKPKAEVIAYMGVAAKPVLQHRAGVVKRVVRRNRIFVCGLCRDEHPKEEEAMGCVESCWEEILALTPVLPRRRGVSMSYRCRFCARDHESQSAAGACAADCRAKQTAAFSVARVADLEDHMVATSRSLRVRRAAAPLRLVAAGRGTKMLKDEGRASPEASPLDPAAGAPSADPGVDLPPQDVAAAEAAKAKPKNVFYRDNAKYACTVCNARFFTRMEVTACYEAH